MSEYSVIVFLAIIFWKILKQVTEQSLIMAQPTFVHISCY